MVFTEQEQRTVQAVFSSLLEMRYSELNRFLGSITIDEMSRIYWKMYHELYCKRHGIKYEDMTDSDFEQEYREIWES